MYDRQTDTLWSQYLGEAVRGPLKGAKLALVASQLTTWAGWKEQHPDTLALDIKTPTIDGYSGYYTDSEDVGIFGETRTDPRLSTKALVIGVVGERSQKAYAYRDLIRSPVINDTFEGRDLVVTINLSSGATAVYDRRVDDKVLTFEPAKDARLMTDRETGSTWKKATGEAVDGALNGKTLEPVNFITSSWFAWTDFYIETELYVP